MSEIHPTAVVDPGASLGDDCQIGPFCVVGPDVVLADSVQLHSHVVVAGHTRIGARCRIFPFATVGSAPQDMKYQGEASTLEIGCDNVVREYVTMNPGTKGGGMLTRIGDGCLFMVGAHVAHDCSVGNRVILANNATLAGHVVVEDGAIIGGLSAVHQFVRIGRQAMIGGMSGVEHDVIPYGIVMGDRARLEGLNIIGLKRCGAERGQIHSMMQAYEALFADEGTLADRAEQLRARFRGNDMVEEILDFVGQDSSRAILQPK